MHDMAAEGGAQGRVGHQAVEHGPVALGNFLVAPAPRSQLGDQMADQFKGVGIRVGEALQRLGQRIAGGGRLAEQPAEKCTHSCHGVVIPFRRRSRRGSPW